MARIRCWEKNGCNLGSYPVGIGTGSGVGSQKLEEIPESNFHYVLLDEESRVLAMRYIEEKAVTENFLLDCQHIALATVCKVDILVSWNFKHIVNYNRIRSYNSVNLKAGYPMLEIRSPREVIDG